MQMKDFNLGKANKDINDWFESMGVRHFSQLSNMGVLMEEVGEVARLIIRIHGDQTFRDGDTERELGPELADVLFSLLCIADQEGVDLGEQFKKKLDHFKQRDTERHQNNKKISGK